MFENFNIIKIINHASFQNKKPKPFLSTLPRNVLPEIIIFSRRKE